jgi:ABC-type transporter Mla subunit MlaD
LENVARTTEELARELARFNAAQSVQEILEATAGRLTGIIARIVQALNPFSETNKRAIERIGSALRSLKLEKEHWLGKFAEANAFLNETLRELDGLRAQQRRHGCIG